MGNARYAIFDHEIKMILETVVIVLQSTVSNMAYLWHCTCMANNGPLSDLKTDWPGYLLVFNKPSADDIVVLHVVVVKLAKSLTVTGKDQKAPRPMGFLL